MVQKCFVGLCFFVATYGNEVIFEGGQRKNADLFMELFTPFEALHKTCL